MNQPPRASGDPRETLPIHDLIMDMHGDADNRERTEADVFKDVYLHPSKALRKNTLEHLLLVAYTTRISYADSATLARLLVTPENELGELREPVNSLVKAMDNYLGPETDINWEVLRLGYNPSSTRKAELERVLKSLFLGTHGFTNIHGEIISSYDLHDAFQGMNGFISPAVSLKEQSLSYMAKWLAMFLEGITSLIVLDASETKVLKRDLPRTGDHLRDNFSDEDLRALHFLGSSQNWRQLNDEEIVAYLGPLLSQLATLEWRQLIDFSALIQEYNWEWAVAAFE